MSVMVYGPVIRDAIARKDVRKMKVLLVKAKNIHKGQGDLPAAIKRLEKAIAKLSNK